MRNFFKSSLIIIVLFFCNMSNAQWYWQNPLPQGNDLQGVYFIDENVGTAVGQKGTILRTNNGGLTWLKQSSGTTDLLYSVYFTDANKGNIAGSRGRILRTTDGGNTWTSQIIGSITNHYTGIYFLNSDLGWIVGAGGTVLRTTNGGVNWNLIFYGGATDAWLQDVVFTDSLNGFVTGNVNGTLRRTTDGGFTWTNIPTGEPGPLYKMCFIDSRNAFIVGGYYGTILNTTDGGVSWNRQVTATPGLLFGISFLNENIGFASGSHGIILKTTDGGSNWLTQTLTTTENLRKIAIGKSTNIFSVGSNGTIIKSSDGGDNWFEVSYAATLNTLFSSSFANDNFGLAVGTSGVIVKTTNGGINWNQQNSSTSNHLRDVSVMSENYAIAVGDNGTLIRTTDGGVNWINKSTGATFGITSVSFADENNGLAVEGGTQAGNSGKIIKTIDGGDNWTVIPNITGNFYDVSFPDQNHATIVGQSGKIWHSNDGGLNWVLQSSSTTNNLNAVSFADSNLGIAVGTSGRIVRTTNGGNTWISVASGTSLTISDISLHDNNFGIAVGYPDAISTIVLRTTDGGITWVRDPIDIGSIPYGIHCINEESGVIVSGGINGGGIILKRGDAPLPTAPSNLNAVACSNYIDLSWSDNSSDEDGFVIERKLGDSNEDNSFAFLASVNSNITTYSDTGLMHNTTYFYRVYAYHPFGESGFSNVAQGTTPLLSTLNLSAIIEGFYEGGNMVTDTVTVELRNVTAPYAMVDEVKIVLNTSGNGTANFSAAVDATNYYIVVKHRNSLETWSKTPQQFTGGTLNYDFTTAATQAYGDNLILKGGKYCLWSGDINQDDEINATDRIIAWNDRNLIGYQVSDVDGNSEVNASDRIICWNNRNNKTRWPGETLAKPIELDENSLEKPLNSHKFNMRNK